MPITLRRQITGWFLDALPASRLEHLLFAAGFTRKKAAIRYDRPLSEVTQRFAILFDVRPRYQPDAMAHVLPQVVLESRILGDIVCRYMAPDESGIWAPRLSALVLRHQLQNVAPQEHRGAATNWFVGSAADVPPLVERIAAFAEVWVLPFLETYRDIPSISRGNGVGDARLHFGDRAELCIAASYVHAGQYDDAMKVLDRWFGNPAPRKRYAKAFAYVQGLRKRGASNTPPTNDWNAGCPRAGKTES